MEESNCYFVSSRGILKSCDVFGYPLSSIDALYGYDFSKIKEKSIVYVCNNAINFLSYNLHEIPHKIILVSGDSDNTCPTGIFNDESHFQKFINDEKIIHWFSQNCIIRHPKITQIPIGLDYHTLSNNVNHPWGDKITSIEEETQLMDIKSQSKEFWNRKIKCYSNFHFSMQTKYAYDRIEAKEKINPELVLYEPTPVKRLDSWKTQSEYAFVLSPHGNGLDCHRTWEALCLGCIVVVKTSSLDPLYEDLPVLIISDWSELKKELMEETVENFTPFLI